MHKILIWRTRKSKIRIFFLRLPVSNFFLALLLFYFSALLISLPFAFHILSGYRKKLDVNYGQSLEMEPWLIPRTILGLYFHNNNNKWHTRSPIHRLASTLRMRTAISPRQWQPWTAVSALLGLITAHQHGIAVGDIAVRMRMSLRFPKPGQIFAEKVCTNLQSPVWSRHIGVPLWYTNMAAGK